MQRPPKHTVIVALAACAAFATSLQVPFLTWDDTYYVTLSGRTQTPGLAGFLNLWSMSDIWNNRFMEFFPLRDTLYWVVFQLFGATPAPFHVLNLITHATASVLLLALARRLAFSAEVAFWGALIFAVHPAHVESVVWVSGLKDPLFSSFVLGSLLMFLAYRRSRRPFDYALMLGLLLLGLLSKSIAIATPIIMLAIERLDPTPGRWAQTIERVTPPALMSLIFTVQYVLVGRSANVISAPHGGSWTSHWLLSAWAFARYVAQALLPTSFSLHYCFAPITELSDPRPWVAALVLTGVALLLRFAVRRAKHVALLVLWFVAFLLPVANLVPFPAVMADRYLYLPSAAACLGVALAFSKLQPRLRRVVLLALVGTFAAISAARGVVWRSEGALWSEVIEQGTCMEDDSVTSAIVYMKDASFQKDPAVVLARYQSTFAHQSFGQMPKEQRCSAFAGAARVAAPSNLPLARSYANEATTTCPWHAEPWDTTAQILTGPDPEQAIDPARRALRLGPTPARRWLLGVALLRAGHADGLAEVSRAVAQAPRKLCRATLELRQQVPLQFGEALRNQPACAQLQQ